METARTPPRDTDDSHSFTRKASAVVSLSVERPSAVVPFTGPSRLRVFVFNVLPWAHARREGAGEGGLPPGGRDGRGAGRRGGGQPHPSPLARSAGGRDG